MIRSCSAVILFGMLIAVSYGSDWLEGGYVGSGDYGEVRQYFTDPIFHIKVPITSSRGYYPPLDRGVFFREPIVLGKYTARNIRSPYQSSANIGVGVYPSAPWQSEFRNKSLAAMHWETFQKNWTGTMIYASTRSSLKIKEGGNWRNFS